MLGGAALVAVLLISLCVGKYAIAPQDLVAALAARLTGRFGAIDPSIDTVVWQIRLPRVLAGLVVGAGLAAVGATYQGLLRNPLVSPDILGVSAGASLGAVLGIFLSLPVVAIQALAFASRVALLRDGRILALGTPKEAITPELMKCLYGVEVAIVYVAAIGRETCVPLQRTRIERKPS